MAILTFLDSNYTDFLLEVNGIPVQGSKGSAEFKHSLSGEQTIRVRLVNGYKLVPEYFTLTVLARDVYICDPNKLMWSIVDERTVLLYTPCANVDLTFGFKAYGPPITRYFPTPKEEKIITPVLPPTPPSPLKPELEKPPGVITLPPSPLEPELEKPPSVITPPSLPPPVSKPFKKEEERKENILSYIILGFGGAGIVGMTYYFIKKGK
jgi:hypothetical protein